MNKIKTLKEHDGDEIEFYCDDKNCISINPPKGHKFLLQLEHFTREYVQIEKIYIVHIDFNGNEISRVDALSEPVSSIYWKQEVINE